MPKQRAQEQIQAGALKSKKIPVGDRIALEQLKSDDFEDARGNKQANDQLICLTPGKKRIKVPVREYLKMAIEGGGSHYKSEEGQDNVKFPKAFIIKKSEDRTDREDNPIFPVFAYKLAEDFVAEGADMTWKELVAGGIKDSHDFDQVQNYTISLEY